MIELNESNFEAEVITKSHRAPVLVDFWADWCAPCKMLIPVLAKLADHYGDRLQIAKVNTDVERGLAQRHGIRSLPTLHLYRNGDIVEEVLGAQSESTLRTLIEAYLERASDSVLEQALAQAAAGNRAQALQLLEQTWRADPGNPRLPLELARLYIDDGQLENASGLLEGLPHEVRESDSVKGLRLLIEFAAAAVAGADTDTLKKKLADNPSDSETRFRLGSQQLVHGDYDAALDNFLELLKRDRSFRDGVAQRGLLTVFSLLGESDARVGSYRRKMFTLLH